MADVAVGETVVLGATLGLAQAWVDRQSDPGSYRAVSGPRGLEATEGARMVFVGPVTSRKDFLDVLRAMRSGYSVRWVAG